MALNLLEKSAKKFSETSWNRSGENEVIFLRLLLKLKKNLLLFFPDLLVKHFRQWRKRLLPTTTILLMKFSKNSFNQKHKNVGKMNSFWGQITKQSNSFRPDLATNLFCRWRKSFFIIFFRRWRKRFFLFFSNKNTKIATTFLAFLTKQLERNHTILSCTHVICVCANSWISFC